MGLFLILAKRTRSGEDGYPGCISSIRTAHCFITLMFSLNVIIVIFLSFFSLLVISLDTVTPVTMGIYVCCYF